MHISPAFDDSVKGVQSDVGPMFPAQSHCQLPAFSGVFQPDCLVEEYLDCSGNFLAVYGVLHDNGLIVPDMFGAHDGWDAASNGRGRWGRGRKESAERRRRGAGRADLAGS